MKIVEIEYPTTLDNIEDITRENIDLFVTLEDGYTCTLTIATPDFYNWYMENEGLDVVPAGIPDIIVTSLTEENIKMAVEEYAKSDAFWIKLYGIMGTWSGILSYEEIDKRYQELALRE